MKPNDKAYQAAILAIKENGPYYAGSKIRESMAKHLAEVALPAAYAAQFQSEEYAELVKRIRSPAMIFYEYDADQGAILRQAADAIEAVLADRAAWEGRQEATAALLKQVETERDALAAHLAPVEDDSRHLTAEEQKVFHSALRRSAKIKKPVDDDALVEIAVKEVEKVIASANDSETVGGARWKALRAAIAAIRPHIEAAAREKIAETVKNWGDEPHFQLLAAAIRRGK